MPLTLEVGLLLFQVELPSAHDLLVNPPEKSAWKHQVKSPIKNYWENQLLQRPG